MVIFQYVSKPNLGLTIQPRSIKTTEFSVVLILLGCI
jgi:hypothetical protein